MKYRLLIIFSAISLTYLTFSCEYQMEEEEVVEETQDTTNTNNDTTSVDTTNNNTDTTTTDTGGTTTPVTYDNTVKAIIDANCAFGGCHGAASVFGDFTTYAGIKIDIDAGKVNNRVVVLKNMPQAGFSDEANRDIIEDWLNDGAPEN